MAEEYTKLDVWKNAEYVLLDLPQEECFARIQKRARKGENKINASYMKQIGNAYEKMSKHLEEKMKILDISGMSTSAIVLMLLSQFVE